MQVACVDRGPGFAMVLGMLATSLVVTSGSAPTWQDSGGGPELQAAVTNTGFVVAEVVGGGRRVTEVARDGSSRAVATFPRSGDVRIVGSRAGVLAVYEEGKRIRLRRVKDGAERGMFGSAVKKLCTGVASSASRFGVGWLESDNKFWFVHGPVSGKAAEVMLVDGEVGALAGDKDWCGIASAEQKIALLWRDRDRLFINTCTEKKCGGLAGSMKLDRKALILGFGCLKNACLLATRAPNGTGKPALSLVTESGAVKWTKPIDASVTDVSIVGVGDRAFAVGVGNRVVRIDRKGNVGVVWTGSAGAGAPQLAWASGRLAIAHGTPGAADIVSVEMPR